MISINNLLKIIRTEAYEHDCAQEVSANQHDTQQDYHSTNRTCDFYKNSQDELATPNGEVRFEYDLELVKRKGQLPVWEE